MRPSVLPAPRRQARFPLCVCILLAVVLAAPAAAGAAPATAGETQPAKRKGGVNLVLTAAGLVLMAGGGAYAYSQDREADRDMRTYRRSAFSDNTSAYRERVEEHQRLTWLGLAGAALGGVLFVVSF